MPPMRAKWGPKSERLVRLFAGLAKQLYHFSDLRNVKCPEVYRTRKLLRLLLRNRSDARSDARKRLQEPLA
jgi:hypothetical protein